jgi:rod shape-determining protein MreD
MKRRILLTALVVTSIVLQAGVLPEMRLLGVVPDLGAVLAVSVAFHEGGDSAALVGFAAGVGFDLFVESPLGLWGLSYAIAGWAIGVIQGGFIRTPRIVPLLLGAFAGLAAGVSYLVLGILTGVDGLVDWGSLGVLARTTLYDIVIAPFVFFVVTKLLVEPSVSSTIRLRPW